MRLTGIAAATLATASAFAAATPPTAHELLAAARTEATPDHRTIWVIFYASW
jgi:hypothetical protein